MPRLSAGCTAGHEPPEGSLATHYIDWEEPGLPAVQRKVLSYLPNGQGRKPIPLVLVFHGWGGHAATYQEMYGFGALAEQAGFLAIYPEGLTDGVGKHEAFTSFNAVGSSSSNASAQSCDVSVTTSGVCYESCKIRKGKCHPCDWTTCYNDVAFMQKLLSFLEERFCVDLDRVYAYGCSNGGMFTHELAQSLPEHFVAITAACGGKPQRGYERNLKPEGPAVSMLLMQGRQDHVIPARTPSPDTGWWDGFYFADELSVVNAYKEYNGCQSVTPRGYSMPPAVRSRNLSCVEHGYQCLQSASVVECTFDLGHDLLLDTGTNSIPDGPEAAWYFMCQHSRAGPIPAENCLLPQSQAAAIAPRQSVVWSMLANAGIGIAFMAFGLSVYLSHRRAGALRYNAKRAAFH